MTNVFIHHIDFKTCGMTTSSMLLFKRKALLLTHHPYEEIDQLTISYEETLTTTYFPVSWKTNKPELGTPKTKTQGF